MIIVGGLEVIEMQLGSIVSCGLMGHASATQTGILTNQTRTMTGKLLYRYANIQTGEPGMIMQIITLLTTFAN